MGILIIFKQKRICGKCGSENYEYFKELLSKIGGGHFEGIFCKDCNHQSKHYVPSLMEQETRSGKAWLHNPSKSLPF